VLAALLSSTRARIYCLVRSSDRTAGLVRLRESMERCGIAPGAAWLARIEPVPGDLAAPGLGLDTAAWQHIAGSAEAIYHLGASLNVLADYATHRKTNVGPMAALVRLAAERRSKPVFFLSPMTVCRRHREGRLQVLHEERIQPDPDGLLTAYAQSKWAGEQILHAAAERGAAVKIYRTSHALPPATTGQAKPHDTYLSVLRAAYAAGVAPDWPDSCFYGMPVDVLARLLVENSLANDGYSGVIHLDNRTPPSLESVLGMLFDGAAKPPRVARDDWKARCRAAATRLAADSALLAGVLFAERRQSAAVDDMFAAHPLDTRYFDSRGQASRLTGLTPASYWRLLRRHFE
jgi:thioester reductase-like protein